MKTVLVLAVSALLALPSIAAAACGGHDDVVMSCAPGSTYDAETKACVPTTG